MPIFPVPKDFELASSRNAELELRNALSRFANAAFISLDNATIEQAKKSLTKLIDSKSTQDEQLPLFNYEVWDIAIHHIYPLLKQAEKQNEVRISLIVSEDTDVDIGEYKQYEIEILYPPPEQKEDFQEIPFLPDENPFPLPGTQAPKIPGEEPTTGEKPERSTSPERKTPTPEIPSSETEPDASGETKPPKKPTEPTRRERVSIPTTPVGGDEAELDEPEETEEETEEPTEEPEINPENNPERIGLQTNAILEKIYQEMIRDRAQERQLVADVIESFTSELKISADKTNLSLEKIAKEIENHKNNQSSLWNDFKQFWLGELYKVDQALGRIETSVVNSVKFLTNGMITATQKYIDYQIKAWKDFWTEVETMAKFDLDVFADYFCQFLQIIEKLKQSCAFFTSRKKGE